MLIRLKVKGFKNLANVDVSFGPFTCIAGANGVGKSNLFDAITFLSALADRPLTEAAKAIRDARIQSGSDPSVVDAKILQIISLRNPKPFYAAGRNAVLMLKLGEAQAGSSSKSSLSRSRPERSRPSRLSRPGRSFSGRERRSKRRSFT